MTSYIVSVRDVCGKWLEGEQTFDFPQAQQFFIDYCRRYISAGMLQPEGKISFVAYTHGRPETIMEQSILLTKEVK